uniref:Uncharacterized protein n=1 Tax=Romanomermis culicivorax TaxID=13658 RepID=A0A915IN25_ROMCU
MCSLQFPLEIDHMGIQTSLKKKRIRFEPIRAQQCLLKSVKCLIGKFEHDVINITETSNGQDYCEFDP